MDFKGHPVFDRSQASDWFDLSDASKPIALDMEPFTKLIAVFREHEEQLERKVLERIKEHAEEDSAKSHGIRNNVFFAPIGDHGFRVYFQFCFLERTDQASADSDFWWGIILCPYVFEDRFGLADIRHWNVVHFGWSVQ